MLLQYLVEKICAHPQRKEFFFLLDPRFARPGVLTDNYVVIPNSLKERIGFYKEHGDKYNKVLCFANTPPTRRLQATVYTYFHNQKLLEAPYKKFNRAWWKLYAKYLVVRRYNKNTDYYVVQTPHMVAAMLKLKLKDATHCLTVPFYDREKYQGAHTLFDQRPVDEFAFVSTPSPQKNYPTLLDAWEYLHEQGHHPALHITIDETAPHLLARVAAMQQKGIRIHNYSYVDPRDLYYKYRYLICPSIMESFGLPLIEATDSGMKVLAPELPYVHDVIRPSLTFDAMDKVSMANAVIAALNGQLPFPEVVTTNKVDELTQLLLQ